MQFVRITIGEDVFVTGDGRLRDVTVALGEGEMTSNVRFTLYDPSGIVANRYFTVIRENEGLEPVSGSLAQPVGTLGQAVDGAATPASRALLDWVANGREYNHLEDGRTFASFAKHPGGLAGRYRLPPFSGDFTPMSQDRVALLQLGESGALALAEAGDFTAAAAIATPDRTEGAADFIRLRIRAYAPSLVASAAAVVAAQQGASKESSPTPQSTLQGRQITVEMGLRDGLPLVAYSFIHTGLRYDRFDSSLLEFSGVVASWVMTRRRKNTAYSNQTLRQVATNICRNYGLTLVMNEPGPMYEYFPQRGVSDYQALLYECRRLGYRLTNVGSQVIIYARADKVAESTPFNVSPGDTTLVFSVNHEAEGESSGGARSSDPSQRSTTGVKKLVLDPDTGTYSTRRAENTNTAGQDTSQAVTGSPTLPLEPLTDGRSSDADEGRRKNEERVRGFGANTSIILDDLSLELTPDSSVVTSGFGDFLDRAWVVESVTHSVSVLGAPTTALVLYSPLRNRYPTPDPVEALPEGSDDIVAQNPGGWVRPLAGGTLTSPFRSTRRPNHAGVDWGAARGTSILSSRDGVVTTVVTGCAEGNKLCGGRYGNHVFIDHGGGFTSRYAHLTRIDVALGQQVRQGQRIGTLGNTGDSTGPHLHFEIRQAGVALNPLRFVGQ